MDLPPFLRTQYFAPLSSGSPHPASDRPVDRQWQVTQERVLLYLRTLEIAAPEALELALEALRRAAKTPGQTSGDHPAASAMLALGEILRERNLGSPTDQPSADGETPVVGIRAMPPLNRGSMVVEEIGQRNWVGFLPRRAQQRVARFGRLVPGAFVYFILVLFFLILVLLIDA